MFLSLDASCVIALCERHWGGGRIQIYEELSDFNILEIRMRVTTLFSSRLTLLLSAECFTFKSSKTLESPLWSRRWQKEKIYIYIKNIDHVMFDC